MKKLQTLIFLSLCAVACGDPSTTATLSNICDEIPRGELTAEQLKQLVPDGSPGKVRIRWRTESQDDNYGFNVYRSDQRDTSYTRINQSIIPGEGSTNIPKDYCYLDTPLPRGAIFYYYIESITNTGTAAIVEGTKNVQVKVKSVEEEREWLRKKAAGIETTPVVRITTHPVAQAVPESQPMGVTVPLNPQGRSADSKTPSKKNPLE